MGLGGKIIEALVTWVLAVLETVIHPMEQAMLRPFKPYMARAAENESYPPEIRDMFAELSGEGHWTLVGVAAGVAIFFIMPFVLGITAPASRLGGYEADRVAESARLSPQDAARVTYRMPEHEETANSDMRDLGWSNLDLQIHKEINRPLLSPDIIKELSLRGLPEYGPLEGEMRKAGYTDDQIKGIKALYWQIPPAQDIIRMAVREVFSPEIAEKFGQFEDFPPEFNEWAQKQGLSSEWAQRYWAAHWDLPSPQQGFEMLHRGVIDEEELGMLLRALDVMPYWRDKLIDISWRIPTRVDIRRMYKLGVYTREDVKATYVKAGYHPTDAESLTEFTIRYYAEDEADEEDIERDYTKSEILDGYRKRILTANEARDLLQGHGYQADQIDYYLQREDLKADNGLRDAYLARYRTLYIEGVAGIEEVIADLEPVGIARSEIEAVLPLWQLDKITRVSRPTKAELMRWAKDGTIDQDRWYYEMRLKGYSDEYIELYKKELPANV